MKYIKDYSNKIKILFSNYFCTNFTIKRNNDKTTGVQRIYNIERVNNGFFNISLEHDYTLTGVKSVEVIVDIDKGTMFNISFSDSKLTKTLSYHQTIMFDFLNNNLASIDTYDMEEV